MLIIMARIVTHTALEEMMLVVITDVTRTRETKSVWLDGWDPAVLLVSIHRGYYMATQGYKLNFYLRVLKVSLTSAYFCEK